MWLDTFFPRQDSLTSVIVRLGRSADLSLDRKNRDGTFVLTFDTLSEVYKLRLPISSPPFLFLTDRPSQKPTCSLSLVDHPRC